MGLHSRYIIEGLDEIISEKKESLIKIADLFDEKKNLLVKQQKYVEAANINNLMRGAMDEINHSTSKILNDVIKRLEEEFTK